jgi:hypothetical protein
VNVSSAVKICQDWCGECVADAGINTNDEVLEV